MVHTVTHGKNCFHVNLLVSSVRYQLIQKKIPEEKVWLSRSLVAYYIGIIAPTLTTAVI